MIVHYSFKGLKQLDDIKHKICHTKFNDKEIEVEELPPSKSVIINNIDETKRKEEYLNLYFNRCGITGFDRVELLDNERVLVHFEDSQSKLTAISITNQNIMYCEVILNSM